MRLEDAAEVTLACLLPGSRLTQCSHSEELVEPAEEEADGVVTLGSRPPVLLCELGRGRPVSSLPGRPERRDPTLSGYDGQEAGRPAHTAVTKCKCSGDGTT